MTRIKAAIIGASGYTGAELLRLALSHPDISIEALAAESNAGKYMHEIYSHFSGIELPQLVKMDAIDYSTIDVAFCCLPHATSQAFISTLPESVKVIDLSADFRLKDIGTYEEWYGSKHAAPELQKEAVYGMAELNREAITESRIIACPGCYPTASTLPLIPLLNDKAISADNIIIDAKSGVTGAGRSAKVGTLFTEINDGMSAYNICKHRHIPEIEQTLFEITGDDINVHFTPHLVPMNRGILATIYVTLEKTLEQAQHALEEYYQYEPFVQVRTDGTLPKTRDVVGTNQCHIAITQGRTAKTAVIVTVIDNLIKGASGQAIQNMNLCFGLEETTGLQGVALFP